MKSKKQIVGSSLVAMVACGLAAGCEGPDSASVAAASGPVAAESAPSASPPAPASAVLDLGSGAEVTFFAQPAGGIAVVERTPKGQPPLAMPLLERQFTALETFRALAAAGTPEPEFLVQDHQLAAARRSAAPGSAPLAESLYGLVDTETGTIDGCTSAEWPAKHAALTADYKERASEFHTTAGVLSTTANIIGPFVKRRADICNGAPYYAEAVLNLIRIPALAALFDELSG